MDKVSELGKWIWRNWKWDWPLMKGLLSCISLGSMSLQPPSSCHPHRLSHVLKPRDQTESPHKYQPSSSNQPNCGRMLCLRGMFRFAGKHYLLASNQPSRAAVSLLRKVGVFFLSMSFYMSSSKVWAQLRKRLVLNKFKQLKYNTLQTICCNSQLN